MQRLLFFVLLFVANYANAQILFQPLQMSPPPCYYQVATNFFPYPLVAQTLSAHKFTQDRWSLIYQDLQVRSAAIPKIIQERASRMVPNPLQPYQPDAAGALLRAVLEETFAQSLRANYFYDPYITAVMFRYIRVQQADRLRACLGDGPMVDRPVTQ